MAEEGEVHTDPLSVQEEIRQRRDITGRARTFLVINIAVVNLVVSTNFAVLAPFFPDEAAKKDVSPAVVGVIFGEFELIVFLTAPIFGIVLPRLGAKFMYISGMFLAGTCSILFGLMAYSPPGAPFIICALLVRGFTALGNSMLVTSSFAIIASSFPQSVTAMFGMLETFNGIGFMIGPPIGGALYEIGGFMLPFGIVGGLTIIIFLLTLVLLKFDSSSLPSETGSFISMLLNPHILLAALILWGIAVTIGFIDPILQPFLSENFQLSEFLVGLVFLSLPLLYSVLSPFIGYLCDKKPVTKQLMSLSLLFIGVAFLTLNPSPLLHIGPPKLWLTILSLIVIGVGASFAFTPCANDILTESLIMGYQDNFGTFSLVSGIINSCLSLGMFSGPLISGLLTGKFGFEWSTTYIGFWAIGVGAMYSLYMIIFMYVFGGRHRVIPSDEDVEPDETQPLLTT